MFPLIIISPIVFPSLGTGFIVSGFITMAPSVFGYLTPCLALISFFLSFSRVFQSSFHAWNEDWNTLEKDKKNEIKARQGVRYPNTEGAIVMNPETMKPVPKDGKTMGEIMIRGNIVMKGYYKDKEATDKAMSGGWFHSGDLAICLLYTSDAADE